MKIWQSLVEALLPRRCALCECASRGEFFCGMCKQGICCDFCGVQKKIRADLMYIDTVQKAVQQAKFGPDQTCAQALVSYWLGLRRDQLGVGDFFPQVQAVCFVPLHWRRRVKRGFDFPSLIARAAANMLHIPLLDALICKRLDMPLSLSTSREQRVLATQGRYGLRLLGNCVTGKKVLLVDDVVTIGNRNVISAAKNQWVKLPRACP